MFARQIAESINLAEGNYLVKRRIIEMLDVEVALCIDEKGQNYVQASCVLGENGLSIESISTSGPSYTISSQDSRCLVPWYTGAVTNVSSM